MPVATNMMMPAPIRLTTQAREFEATLRRSYGSNECSWSIGHEVTSGRLEKIALIAIRIPMPNSVSNEVPRMMMQTIEASMSIPVGVVFIGILPALDL